MQSSKEYIVYRPGIYKSGNIFVVRASNRQEAINKVWNKIYKPKVAQDRKDGYKPVYKKELRAKNLSKIHKEDEDIAQLDYLI